LNPRTFRREGNRPPRSQGLSRKWPLTLAGQQILVQDQAGFTFPDLYGTEIQSLSHVAMLLLSFGKGKSPRLDHAKNAWHTTVRCRRFVARGSIPIAGDAALSSNSPVPFGSGKPERRIASVRCFFRSDSCREARTPSPMEGDPRCDRVPRLSSREKPTSTTMRSRRGRCRLMQATALVPSVSTRNLHGREPRTTCILLHPVLVPVITPSLVSGG
jgi:hypothetical protein